MLDKSKFFDAIRDDYRLTNKNVTGFDFIIDYGVSQKTRRDDLSNILATTWWETAQTMEPIAEFGKGKGKKYGVKDRNGQVAYGRGYVQLTHPENYEKADRELGLKGALVKNYDLALDPDIAVKILFRGMHEGWFTGKKLSDYIDNIDESYKEDLREFSNARRIINGTDKQVIIGQIAWSFKQALKVAGYGEVESTIEIPIVVVEPPVALPDPIKDAMELVLRKEDLQNVNLLDFYNALKALIERNADVR